MIKSFQDLEVYKLSYQVAMDIFHLSIKFPKEELYSLTSQIVRSSRSISANIVEGWSKRHYENKFKVHLIDALGSTGETRNWINFAKDCGYITQEEFLRYDDQLDHIGKMLTKLHQKWETKGNI
jgi:four helix bundle protein